MAKHIALGKYGEKIAANYLHKKGFKIISLNWRHTKAEVDIIAETNNLTVFVEVKTRKNEKFVQISESITEKKQEMLRIAAESYASEMSNEKLEFRFDLIFLLGTPELGFNIEHIEDAFR